MTTSATRNVQEHTTEGTLCVAFALREKTWKLGFTPGHGQQPRERTVTARQQERVLDDIAHAKRRRGLPASAAVVSGYEAGREGFWLHRFLQGHGITKPVVDSSSIEVNRRRRRAKSDGVDVRKLLRMLLRYAHGERQVWQVVQVPSVEAADHRHLHRDLATLKQERASTMTRIEGLLRSQGLRVTSLTQLPEQREAVRLWDGSPRPPGLRRRVLRVYAHYTFLSEQIAAVEAERRAQLQTSSEVRIDKVRQLRQLKGIGINGAWVWVMAFLAPFKFQLTVSEETSGGGRMVILNTNPEDSSPSTTNQRPHDEVYQTPRFRSPDPYPDRHARVAASRCLRENDGNRPVLSDIPDLSLSTAFDGTPCNWKRCLAMKSSCCKKIIGT